ncbi:MAG: cellulase family glycosylhydrolase [Anaerolineae bacterium]|nr:glycoside hydrolase family 5 protein [Thermoflexales bacterium]MDW8408831.1 cellulase family glycosylhydrolase [Anaerolineae bacterium]
MKYVIQRALSAAWIGLLLLSGCTARWANEARSIVPAITSEAAQLCRLDVDGAVIRDQTGRQVVLHGANLPSLSEMSASTYPVAQRLRDLAEAGATVVRLRVDDSEITPTFVPGPLIDFIRQANRLGLVVILSRGDVVQTPVNRRVNDAESWLRLMVDYLKNNPGVWFDPVDAIRDVSPRRQRAIAQRFVDVARGYNAHNIIVVNRPEWFTDNDPELRRPLSGKNVVYGIDIEDMNRYPLGNAPFLLTRWQSSRVAEDELGIGVIAAEYDPHSTNPSNGAVLRRYWQRQAARYPFDLRDCHSISP